MISVKDPLETEPPYINCKKAEEFNNGSNLYLYLIDCIEGMRQLNPQSVDVVVTSPPYNLGINYNGYNDHIPREEYLDWTEKWGAEVKRVLSDNGSFFLNIGSKPTDPTVPFFVMSRILPHFTLQNTIHWIKSVAILKEDVGNYPGITQDVAVGHYKPINSERFLNDCHEFIFHFTKTGNIPLDRASIGVPYQDKSNIKRWKSSGNGLRCRGNTWFIPYETIQSRDSERPHPATFPPKLPEMCIKLHGLNKTKMVLDPFMGIGNTAAACKKLSIDCIGFEVAEDYYKESLERFKKPVSDISKGEDKREAKKTQCNHYV